MKGFSEGQVSILGFDCVRACKSEGGIEEERLGGLDCQELHPKVVNQARKKDAFELKQYGVHWMVKREEGWGNAGKTPISTRWVDVSKGNEEDPDSDSELVSHEFKRDTREQ